MVADIIIKNGKIVFPNITLNTDLAIDDGKIVAIGSKMPMGDKVIDAKGKFILPGCIDPHVHICEPFMGVPAIDDFYVATKATSLGGTTTIIDFATQQKGDSIMKAAHNRRLQADGKVVIDYSLHLAITDLPPDTAGQIENAIANGFPSFKLFLVYREEGLMVDDGILLRAFEKAKIHGGLIGLHAENIAMIEYLRNEAIKNGNVEAIYHALTRPPITEAEAVNRATFIANYLKAPYYNFHLTIKEGVEIFREARKKGQPVYAETCTHYLIRTMEDLKSPNGINFICTPPLRTKEDQEALWRGLSEGVISAVSSDNCAFTTEMKMLGKDSFDKVPNGLHGQEFRLPILFSEGVRKGRISVNRLSEITSTNVAKIFGLYPKKGIIGIGSDADLVILDPKLEKTITVEDSIYGTDWTPYEGMKILGYPVVTISKGKIIWEKGQFCGKEGNGKFLKRSLDSQFLKHPLA